MVAGVGIWITDDVAAARDQANIDLAIYGQLPSYRAMMDREGAKDPADLVLIGDDATVRAGLESYRDAGTDEAEINVLGRGDDREAGLQVAEQLGGNI